MAGTLAAEPLPSAVIVERNIMVPMRDGVKLATYVRRPEVSHKVPAILIRSPYKAEPPGKVPRELARPGDRATQFAVVMQDTRGRYASEGEFTPFFNEAQDGYDAVEWVAQQPWCDGNVGMAGGSYLGYTQLAAAMAQPPHLRAICATVPPADINGGTLFYGGAMRQELAQAWMIGQAFNSQRVLRKEVPQAEVDRWRDKGRFDEWCWHLPLRDPGAIVVGGPSYEKTWQSYIEAWTNPHKWDEHSPMLNANKITVPVLLIAGWFDIFSQPDIDFWKALRERGGSEPTRKETRLLMGPWVHGIERPAGSVNFPKALNMRADIEQRWFDRWLRNKTDALEGLPPLRYFHMHENRWVDGDQWPPKSVQAERYYLDYDPASRRRSLSLKSPAADTAPSQYTYDARRPVPTRGGNNLTISKGIQDHWDNTQRRDVLGFESAPLEKDLAIAGHVRVRLVVASSAADTDFTAMLLDVTPSADASERAQHHNVLDGVVRARFRNGRDKNELLEPEKPVEVEVDLWSTAYTFKAGHRIRLDVSSSNFPRFDRNLNTADAPGHGTAIQQAENKIFHDAQRLSFVELPVQR